ncbi:Zn-ribbon-containing protein [Celerinatantimonas yamalensis]|uniref:Zn-ribbon-containing protein n=1 Tax=Celerinatantimonas yamalensis TaxID=559956 RepID=A0ABW9G812_9GAMM
MYQQQLTFECFDNTTISAAQQAIMAVLDALRYNGQILGREFPCSFAEGTFISHVITPENESLHSQFHSPQVRHAMEQLAEANILRPKIKELGRELFSDTSENGEPVNAYILYTSFIHSCSPLRSMERFLPVPLYHIPPVANGDQNQIIKWQEDWGACDQLQMNGSILEAPAVKEIAEPGTRLFQRGWDLARRINYLTQKPTYLYLYRVGGISLESEQQRLCPVCGGPWHLDEPLHDLFDFRCDNCLLVSNLSWDFK